MSKIVGQCGKCIESAKNCINIRIWRNIIKEIIVIYIFLHVISSYVTILDNFGITFLTYSTLINQIQNLYRKK